MVARSLTDRTSDALRNAGAYLSDLAEPTIRLGVTGLARSGKTVLITALVHNLIAGGRLPFFDAVARGRVSRAYLQPQPDHTVPRFAYEESLAALFGEPPDWPQSTRTVSELRVTLDYAPTSFLRRQLGVSRLHLDIVDYPGEWLLDLALLDKPFEDFSREAIGLLETRRSVPSAAAMLDFLKVLDADGPADEAAARRGADLYKAYLAASRGEGNTLSTLPPGRFLLPGELDGTPALTFHPVAPRPEAGTARSSHRALCARRYDAYVKDVVKPFFRDHFARLDRQIVLVDVLSALNGGRAALTELERALADVLAAFRVGANTWLSSVFARRIDRILLAATKADHLHHTSHDRLETLMRHLTTGAIRRAEFSGAEIKALALAAVRSTVERDVVPKDGSAMLACIAGVPMPGERIDGLQFDGVREAVLFPGDLPEDPAALLAASATAALPEVRFVRFRPARAAPDRAAPPGRPDLRQPLPNIRLDRALEFLIGDRLQ